MVEFLLPLDLYNHAVTSFCFSPFPHSLTLNAHFSVMENIKHSDVQVRGLKLHVAKIGSGPKAVLFLHGFPEIWYSWRHQMIAVAKVGYRAIAIDFRGYGLSEQSAEPEKAILQELVDNVVGPLDALSIKKAVLVAQDFVAFPAFLVATVQPERVASVITVGVPFMLPGPSAAPTQFLPKGFYMTRWQEAGRAEADFARFDVKSVIRNVYILFSKYEVPIAAGDQEIMDLYNPSTSLPPWFSEEDLAIYASLYEKSGIRYALQVPYRTMGVDCGISNPKFIVPAMLIMGEKDYVLKFPGIDDHIKQIVHDYEITFIPEGIHFVNEQFPEKVNQLIIEFLGKQSP